MSDTTGESATTRQTADPKISTQSAQNKLRASLGTKLIYVLLTGIVSLIPLLAVAGVLAMRHEYSDRIIRSLENELGGHQRLFGPVVVVPTKWIEDTEFEYQEDGTRKRVQKAEAPDVYFMPENLAIDASLNTREFTASVYDVIGYENTTNLSADFPAINLDPPYVEGVEYLWDEAWVVVYLTNTASTKFRPELEIGGERIPFYAGLGIGKELLDKLYGSRQTRSEGSLYRPLPSTQGYSARVGKYIDPDTPFSVNTRIAFNGATAFAVAPVGRDMSLAVKSSETPSSIRNFSADFDSIGQKQDAEEFSNVWNTAGPYRSGKFSDVRRDTSSSLLAKQDFVIEFDPQNVLPYEEIGRALRYGFFLMGFSFLTFFILETMSKQYLHVAQYFLLGLIQAVFYALLLGVAEFTGFDSGFFLAAVPTVGVTALVIGRTLQSISIGGIAVVIFGAFYSVQYILMDMAQYSLLVAAGASFIAIALALIVTSRMDWSRMAGQ